MSSLPIFKLSHLSFCCLAVRVLYPFWILGPYQVSDLQNFLSFLGCLFTSFDVQVFNSDKVQIIDSFVTQAFLVSIPLFTNENYPEIQFFTYLFDKDQKL